MTSFIFYLFFIPLLAIILLAINFVFAIYNPNGEKRTAFECGFHSFLGQNRSQFNISFFIFALLFLLFDLEILLIYPYALSSNWNDIYGLLIMLIFFILLTIGFIYELGRKALVIYSRQNSVKKSYFFSPFLLLFLDELKNFKLMIETTDRSDFIVVGGTIIIITFITAVCFGLKNRFSKPDLNIHTRHGFLESDKLSPGIPRRYYIYYDALDPSGTNLLKLYGSLIDGHNWVWGYVIHRGVRVYGVIYTQLRPPVSMFLDYHLDSMIESFGDTALQAVLLHAPDLDQWVNLLSVYNVNITTGHTLDKGTPIRLYPHDIIEFAAFGEPGILFQSPREWMRYQGTWE